MTELLKTWQDGFSDEPVVHDVIAGILTLDLAPFEAVVLAQNHPEE